MRTQCAHGWRTHWTAKCLQVAKLVSVTSLLAFRRWKIIKFHIAFFIFNSAARSSLPMAVYDMPGSSGFMSCLCWSFVSKRLPATYKGGATGCANSRASARARVPAHKRARQPARVPRWVPRVNTEPGLAPLGTECVFGFMFG
jgi:hypothetical protein